MVQNPTVRKWIYVVSPTVSVLLLILVTAGVIDEGTSATIATMIASVLGVVTGGLATANIAPRPSISVDGLQVISDALEARAQSVIGAGAAAVDQARRDLEHRLGR